MMTLRAVPARLLLVATFFAWIQSAVGAQDEPSIALTTGYASRAVYRGVERATSAWQTSLQGQAGAWRGAVYSTRSFDSVAPDELSSALGYVWNLDGTLTVEAWGTHFWYVDQPVAGAPAHSFEADLKLSWAFRRDWRLSLLAGYDIRYRSNSIEGSIDYELLLSSWGTYLQLRAYAGSVAAKDLLPDAAFSRLGDDYAYGGVSFRLPYHFTHHSSVAVDGHYVFTRNQATEWSPLGVGSGSRQWINLSYRYEF